MGPTPIKKSHGLVNRLQTQHIIRAVCESQTFDGRVSMTSKPPANHAVADPSTPAEVAVKVNSNFPLNSLSGFTFCKTHFRCNSFTLMG